MKPVSPRPISLGAIWTHFSPILRPFSGRLGAGVALILGSTAIEIALPIIAGRTVDAAVTDRSLSRLYTLCGLYGVLLVVKAIAESAQAYVIQSTGQAVTHALRDRLFGRILDLPVGYFDRHPTGRLVTRVINDIKSLSELFTASISVLALDAFVIAGTIAAMVWVEWRLALLVLVTFPLVTLTIHFFGQRLANAYRDVRARLAEINAFLGENIGAIATIQRLGAEEERHAKLAGILQGHQAAQMRSLGVFATVQPIANVLNGAAVGTLLGVGGMWVLQGKMTVGVIVAFLGYIKNLYQPVRDLVEKYNTFLTARVAAERVAALLDEPVETKGGVFAPRAEAPLEIRFDGVNFRYPTRTPLAVGDINFAVPPGRSLAVVGATGGGKSTLVRLLLRFYEPEEGRILVGGADVREWDLTALRRAVGVIQQEIYLFQGTLRDNLALGDTNVTDARLIEICRRAQLWPLVEGRGGLDLGILEGGTNLSVGERQLVAFARVLTLDTPILILDEATASVDRALEVRLMDAVRETMAGRTSLVIAHRLSTIRRCDAVMVLEHGTVVEHGGHDELLGQGGLFARFHAIHSGA